MLNYSDRQWGAEYENWELSIIQLSHKEEGLWYIIYICILHICTIFFYMEDSSFFIFMLPDLDVNKDHMCTWRRTNDSTNHRPPLPTVSQSPPSDHVMESTHTTPGAAAAGSHNIQPPPPPPSTLDPPVMSRPVFREVLRISPLLRILLTRWVSIEIR